jgi:hypothetical protein
MDMTGTYLCRYRGREVEKDTWNTWKRKMAAMKDVRETENENVI